MLIVRSVLDIQVKVLIRRKIYEVRAQHKGLGQKKKFGSQWYVDSIKSSESRWSHLWGGQTEKRGGSSGILTFTVQGGMEKLAKRATKEEEENQKSRTPGGKYGKCFK